jgi:hypothetical protein
MIKKMLQNLTADHEKWDSHVALPEYTAVVSDADDKALDDALGLQLISIRLSKSLIERLKALATLEGLGYQPLMRQVLTRFVRENEHKLAALHGADDAVARADKLFLESVNLMSSFEELHPLTVERLQAEADCNMFLRQSRALFSHVLANTSDSLLRQHCSLRLAQIEQFGVVEIAVPKKVPEKKKAAAKPRQAKRPR